MDVILTRHILALGPASAAFQHVADILSFSGYRVTVLGPPTDGTAMGHVPLPDLIVLNYEWSPETHSREVFALLGIKDDISPVPIVVCCKGLGFARESFGALATKGIEIVMHPVNRTQLLETVARRLQA